MITSNKLIIRSEEECSNSISTETNKNNSGELIQSLNQSKKALNKKVFTLNYLTESKNIINNFKKIKPKKKEKPNALLKAEIIYVIFAVKAISNTLLVIYISK